MSENVTDNDDYASKIHVVRNEEVMITLNYGKLQTAGFVQRVIEMLERHQSIELYSFHFGEMTKYAWYEPSPEFLQDIGRAETEMVLDWMMKHPPTVGERLDAYLTRMEFMFKHDITHEKICFRKFGKKLVRWFVEVQEADFVEELGVAEVMKIHDWGMAMINRSKK